MKLNVLITLKIYVDLIEVLKCFKSIKMFYAHGAYFNVQLLLKFFDKTKINCFEKSKLCMFISTRENNQVRNEVFYTSLVIILKMVYFKTI